MLTRALLSLLFALSGLAAAQASFRVPTANDLYGQWVTVAQVLDGQILRYANTDFNPFFAAQAAFEFRRDKAFFFIGAITADADTVYGDTVMFWFAQSRPATLSFAGPDATGLVRVSGSPQNPGPGYAFTTALATADTSLRGLIIPVRAGELVLTFVMTDEEASRLRVQPHYMIRVLRRVDLSNPRNLPQQIPIAVLR